MIDEGCVGTSVAVADDLPTETLTRQYCSAQASTSATTGEFLAAITWISRALELLNDEERVKSSSLAPSRNALLLRRAEYAMQAKSFNEALGDAEAVRSGSTETKVIAKAVRLKCRALLSMDRRSDALSEWQLRLSMGSSVLDELAFRREFGVQGEKREDDDARYDMVLQYLYRRDFGNAISWLNKTLDVAKKGKGKSKNKDPVLFLLRARCRMELQEFEGAVADAERVITLLPTAVEAYRWLCEASIALNKHSHARDVCQLGLSLSPQDEALRDLQGRLQKSKMDRGEKLQRRQKKALPVYEEIPKNVNPNKDDEGKVEEEEEDPVFAEIRALKRAVKTEPRNADLHIRLAALRFGLKHYDQAQSDAAQAIALDGTAIGGYLRSCEALFELRRYAKALRVCEQGLRMVDGATIAELELLQTWETRLQETMINPPPDDTPEYTGPTGKSRVPKAVAARKQQRAQRKVDDAQVLRSKCYEKAVELADDRDFGNAVFWLNKAEGYDAAGKDFGTARIYALRARCRFELKQYEHVATDAERAISLEPTDTESYRWLCLSFKARGHTDKARAACATGLQVDPDHKQLLALMKGLGVSGKPSTK